MHWAITTCQLTLDNESMKISRKVTGLLSVALLAFVVTPVMAQGRGGQGARISGGGFGAAAVVEACLVAAVAVT